MDVLFQSDPETRHHGTPTTTPGRLSVSPKQVASERMMSEMSVPRIQESKARSGA